MLERGRKQTTEREGERDREREREGDPESGMEREESAG